MSPHFHSIAAMDFSILPLGCDPIVFDHDQMKFDKKIIKVNSNQKVTLTLNHNGRFPASSMGHNFVLLKADVDARAITLNGTVHASETIFKKFMQRNSDFIVVIPARYGSKRFPGKPLIDIKGVPMIVRTFNQCRKANNYCFTRNKLFLFS